jgi:hypothetical protein
MGGSGRSEYQEFVRHYLPELRLQGHSNTDAMRAVAAMWRRHKNQSGRGLVETGGAGLVLTGAQYGDGTAADISKYADYTSKALGAASFIPGVGELAAPAAGVAKGVSYISSLFE